MPLLVPMLRGVLATLGSALPCTAAPFSVLFTPTPLPLVLPLVLPLACVPVIVESLFGAAVVTTVLTGDWVLLMILLLVRSRFRTAVPFLKLVVGGSGSGRVLAGVWVIEL